ncbi:MAG: hypothetical protein Q9214_004690 [Letrouitia sp. 1 TL-2023]
MASSAQAVMPHRLIETNMNRMKQASRIVPVIPRIFEKRSKPPSSSAPPVSGTSVARSEAQSVSQAAKSQDSPSNVIEQKSEDLLVQTANSARASNCGEQDVKNAAPEAYSTEQLTLTSTDDESLPSSSELAESPKDTIVGSLHNTSNNTQATSVQTTSPNPCRRSPSPTQASFSDDSVTSPPQSFYQDHRRYPSLHSQPPAQSAYYGYGHTHSFSFYPHSNRSCGTAFPAQSSYEGYVMAQPPHGAQSPNLLAQRGSSSTPDIDGVGHTDSLDSLRSGSSQGQHTLQYSASLPNFGNTLPFTPSATPSNHGSQFPEAIPAHVGGPLVERRDLYAAPKLSPTSGEYSVWCQRVIDILQDVPGSSDSQFQLTKHLLDETATSDFVDCHLHIHHESGRFDPVVLSLHAVLIAQNEKLRKMLRSTTRENDGKWHIRLEVNNNYVTSSSVESALQTLYGASAFTYTAFPPSHNTVGGRSKHSALWMTSALSYAATGHFMGISDVAHRGEHIASAILNWDNIEEALAYAFDDSFDRVWGSTGAAAVAPENFPSDASEVLLTCLFYIITNMPFHFHFDSSAKSLPAINRLPIDYEPKVSSKDRLNRIQFGDLPTDLAVMHNKQEKMISSILISVPFHLLVFIFDRLSIGDNRHIARLLINEREHRRFAALAYESTKDKQNGSFTEEMRWRESVAEPAEGSLKVYIERSRVK